MANRPRSLADLHRRLLQPDQAEELSPAVRQRLLRALARIVGQRLEERENELQVRSYP